MQTVEAASHAEMFRLLLMVLGMSKEQGVLPGTARLSLPLHPLRSSSKPRAVAKLAGLSHGNLPEAPGVGRHKY